MEISSFDESNGLPASQEQRDVGEGSESTGAGTMPQVREKGAAMIPEEARKEPASGGTTTKGRLPLLHG